MNTLKQVVENHFSKVIGQIEAGLPEVIEDEVKAEVFAVTEEKFWTCPMCQNQMGKELAACNICRTKKPDLSLLQK